jgi:hypothetical protein
MSKKPRRRSRAARPTVTKHLELDQYMGVLDIAVINVLSQAEFLLNRAREIQRHVLRVRGVAGGSIATRKAPAVVVQRIAREMRSESRQLLAQVLKDLEYSANALKRAERIGEVLASLAHKIGRHVPGGVEFDVTNEELASAANITPFT